MVKRYTFYVKDPLLQETLDALVDEKTFTPTMVRLCINGLSKDVIDLKKTLKERLKRIEKLEELQKKAKTQRAQQFEKAYHDYCEYRKGIVEYDHKLALIWLSKRAKEMTRGCEELLSEFETKYAGKTNG